MKGLSCHRLSDRHLPSAVLLENGLALHWQKSIETKVHSAAETLFPMCLLFSRAGI
jgi:hypothetical protein